MRFLILITAFSSFVACHTSSDSKTNAALGPPSTPAPALQITSIQPTHFGIWGGGTLTLTGTGLVAGSSVSIDSQSCSNVVATAQGQLTCTLPAHAAGTASVYVTTPSGTVRTLSASLTYQTFLYIGRQSTNGSVDGFALDPTRGSLTAIAGSPFTTTGSMTYGVAMAPSGHFLYAANFLSNTVSAFRVDAGRGALTLVENYTTNTSPTALRVDPHGKFVVVSGYGACAQHAVFAIDPLRGTLSQVAGSPFQDTPCQSASGGVVISPDGAYVYFANFNSSSVSAFKLDSSTGRLTPLSGSPFNSGGLTGPDTLTIHPSGKYLFLANASNPGMISTFTVDISNGELTPLAPTTVAFNASGGAGIGVSDDGVSLYYTGQSAATMAPFFIDPSSGALAALPTLSTDSAPQDVVVDPSGKFVFTSNVLAKTTNGYSRDSSQGAVTALSPSSYSLGQQGGLMCFGR